MMLGLFASERGLAIGENDFDSPPDYSALEGLPGRYNRIATFAVVIDDEAQTVGLYEEIPPSPWERAVRKEVSETCQE